MMGLMVVMFYFLLIRPQQKQRKEMAARIASLASGDKVVTTSGIHGIVHNVKEHTVIVKVAEGTMLEFDKPAIAHRPQKGHRRQIKTLPHSRPISGAQKPTFPPCLPPPHFSTIR